MSSTCICGQCCLVLVYVGTYVRVCVGYVRLSVPAEVMLDEERKEVKRGGGMDRPTIRSKIWPI